MKEFRVLQHIISCQQSQALNIKSQCWHFFSQTWQSAHPQISYKKKEPWGCYWLCTTKKLWYNHNSSLQNKLFRWLQTFNVTTASNARQRNVGDEWFGDDLIIEVAPFQSDVWWWYWSLQNLVSSIEIYWWFTFTYNEPPRWLRKVLLFPWKSYLFAWEIYIVKAFKFPYQLEKLMILRLPLYMESQQKK